VSKILYTEERAGPMSFGEKTNWVYVVVTAATFAVYLAIVIGRADGVPITEVTYVPTMLWAIGIGIALSILGSIAVAVSKPKEADKTDERDKQINRFGDYVGGVAFGISMIIPFGLAVTESDHFWIANAIFAGFVLTSILSSTVKIVGYHRGL
jgi:uncharacterized membrane protein